MAKRHGRHGTVKHGNPPVSWCVRQASVNASVQLDDVTDNCSGGFEEYVVGNRRATFSIQMWYDGSNPPAVNEGDILTDLDFEAADGHGYEADEGIVESVDFTLVDVAGAQGFSITGRFNGPYVRKMGGGSGT